VAHGQSNREIAEELTISEATVRTHVSNILGKLELCSRTQAALYALRKGLASLNDVD
jgi:NarL family two-component system response regulator LiaR